MQRVERAGIDDDFNLDNIDLDIGRERRVKYDPGHNMMSQPCSE